MLNIIINIGKRGTIDGEYNSRNENVYLSQYREKEEKRVIIKEQQKGGILMMKICSKNGYLIEAESINTYMIEVI